jgi:toxin ParE1/3/4
MRKIIKSPLAWQDQIDIWNFIAQNNPVAADKVISKLDKICFKLLEYPELGMLHEELGTKIRSISAGNYVIFYRPSSDAIQIIRILHGARDIREILGHGGRELKD